MPVPGIWRVCVTLFIKWLWEYKQSVEGQRRKGHLRWPVRKQRNWGNPAHCLEGSRTQCDSGWSWSFPSGQLVNGSKHTEPWTWAINKKDHWSWPLSNRRKHSSVRVPSEPWVYSCFLKNSIQRKGKPELSWDHAARVPGDDDPSQICVGMGVLVLLCGTDRGVPGTGGRNCSWGTQCPIGHAPPFVRRDFLWSTIWLSRLFSVNNKVPKSGFRTKNSFSSMGLFFFFRMIVFFGG